MSRLMITSDLHLGHTNICKFRTQFSSPEEHHETVFENLATNIRKRDSVYFLGDIAFTKEWLARIAEINCVKKTLILGNHDTEKLKISEIIETFDAVHSLQKRRNTWFSHCPIHPGEFRGSALNIHGHLHGKVVIKLINCNRVGSCRDDRYFNACVEHTDYKPISFAEIIEKVN